MGFIFGSLMVLAGIFVWFCVPECRGKTLEEIDFLFNNGVPLRNFGKTDAAALMRAEVDEKSVKLDEVELENVRSVV